MPRTRFHLIALCLAAAALPAVAQTTRTPAPDADAAAKQQAAGTSQNPSVNGYKDSKPVADAAQRPSTGTRKEGDGSKDPNPTSTDSMGKDNRARHPAADGKTSDPK